MVLSTVLPVENSSSTRTSGPVPGQQARVLGQQQVRGGVASATPRSRPPARPRRPGGGWSAGTGASAEAVGDARGRGRWRSRRTRGRRPRRASSSPSSSRTRRPSSNAVRRRPTAGAAARACRARWRPADGPAWGCGAARGPSRLAQAVAADELDAEPLGDPLPGPDASLDLPSVRCRSSFRRCRGRVVDRSAAGPRRAAPRSRCPRGPRRRPRRAAGCARPRRGAASPRSSCSCTRSAARPRRRVSGRRMSAASLNSSWVTTDSACTGGTCEGWMQVLPCRPLARSSSISRSSPSMSCSMSASRSSIGLRSRKGLLPQLRLEHALLDAGSTPRPAR